MSTTHPRRRPRPLTTTIAKKTTKRTITTGSDMRVAMAKRPERPASAPPIPLPAMTPPLRRITLLMPLLLPLLATNANRHTTSAAFDPPRPPASSSTERRAAFLMLAPPRFPSTSTAAATQRTRTTHNFNGNGGGGHRGAVLGARAVFRPPPSLSLAGTASSSSTAASAKGDAADVVKAPDDDQSTSTPTTTTTMTAAAAAQPPPTPTRSEEIRGLLQMCRLNTLPMGAALVGVGAYGARHANANNFGANGGASNTSQLIIGSLLTVIVTASSMLINDYYDHRDGVDTPVTKPGRPLVEGQVRPSTVKFVLKWAYAIHLTLLCLVDLPGMRLWVLANTLLTYVYSVHLKPVTGVKNLVCASIVSMAVGLGALSRVPPSTSTLTSLAAAAATVPFGSPAAMALRAVWRPMVAVGGLIWHREIVMDVKDMDGDRSAGVRTLPVVYGRKRALLLSLLPLACAAIASATVGGAGANGGSTWLLSRRGVVASVPMVVQGVMALRCARRGYDHDSLTAAIELAPLLLAVTLVSLVWGS